MIVFNPTCQAAVTSVSLFDIPVLLSWASPAPRTPTPIGTAGSRQRVTTTKNDACRPVAALTERSVPPRTGLYIKHRSPRWKLLVAFPPIVGSTTLRPVSRAGIIPSALGVIPAAGHRGRRRAPQRAIMAVMAGHQAPRLCRFSTLACIASLSVAQF
jgi:hypothetical protein